MHLSVCLWTNAILQTAERLNSVNNDATNCSLSWLEVQHPMQNTQLHIKHSVRPLPKGHVVLAQNHATWKVRADPADGHRAVTLGFVEGSIRPHQQTVPSKGRKMLVETLFSFYLSLRKLSNTYTRPISRLNFCEMHNLFCTPAALK